MNSIYNQARIPSTNAEKLSFVGYILSWQEMTLHHHDAVLSNKTKKSKTRVFVYVLILVKEEKFWFPACEKRVSGSAATNVEQHHAFHNGLVSMEEYCKQVQTDPSKYNAETILQMLNEFGDLLYVHLNDEIETLEPDKMHQIFGSEHEAESVVEAMVKWGVQHASLTRSVPFVNPPLQLQFEFRLIRYPDLSTS